ncbi:MAG: hypothetical protein N3F67_05685 [Acidilobaceae archaeon]|nr:hypothetical protein [Acidilobaceae archaeon]
MAASADRRTLVVAAALLISIVALGISLLAVAQVGRFGVAADVRLPGFFAGIVAEDPRVQIVNFRVCRNNVSVDARGNVQVRGFAFNISNVGNVDRSVVAMVSVIDAQGNVIASGARRDIVVPAGRSVEVVVVLNRAVNISDIARVAAIVQAPARAGP